MSKTTRLYQDTRTASAAGASHMDQLNGELQDVTRIMTKNMEELLWRGDSLDRESTLSARTVFRQAHVVRDCARDVALVDVSAVRVGEIPQGRTEYQLPSDATAVCTHRRRAVHSHHPHLVAVLMRRPGFHGLAALYSSLFTTFNVLFSSPHSTELCDAPGEATERVRMRQAPGTQSGRVLSTTSANPSSWILPSTTLQTQSGLKLPSIYTQIIVHRCDNPVLRPLTPLLECGLHIIHRLSACSAKSLLTDFSLLLLRIARHRPRLRPPLTSSSHGVLRAAVRGDLASHAARFALAVPHDHPSASCEHPAGLDHLYDYRRQRWAGRLPPVQVRTLPHLLCLRSYVRERSTDRVVRDVERLQQGTFHRRLICVQILTEIPIASYQTPQGVVNGIQWIPAEATSVVPSNATPAGAVSPSPAEQAVFFRI